MAIIRPVLFVGSAIFSPIYKLLFGWLDNRQHKKLESDFERDIVQHLPWLFESKGAKVVPNSRNYPRAFDYAVITVALDPDLLLRFIRGRGDLRADVTAYHSPNDWQDLAEAIADTQGAKKGPRYYRLEDVERLLQQHLDALRSYLSRNQ